MIFQTGMWLASPFRRKNFKLAHLFTFRFYRYMYVLNENSNTVSPLEKRTFSSLKLSERNHLQKWILNNPEMLGEELLILQEEFDGWDETRERLDVLALDKNGRLVVIENKLDDSGRDVVWQACLLYTSPSPRDQRGSRMPSSA